MTLSINNVSIRLNVRNVSTWCSFKLYFKFKCFYYFIYRIWVYLKITLIIITHINKICTDKHVYFLLKIFYSKYILKIVQKTIKVYHIIKRKKNEIIKYKNLLHKFDLFTFLNQIFYLLECYLWRKIVTLLSLGCFHFQVIIDTFL